MKDKKDKAVFLGAENQINRVYREMMPKLVQELEFPAEVIHSDNIEKYKDFTGECKYIFTTWGMFTGVADYFKSCEALFYGAGSVQHFAREYLERGVRISSAWVANGVPVAEMAVSQIILACKGFFAITGKVKSPEDWREKSRIAGENYRGNYNKKIGILGAGTIGRRIIDNLKRLEVKAEILVYDPYYSDETAKKTGVRKASLEEIFQTCNVISNSIANLPSTVGMINKSHFSLMQDYSTFINTGRGAQIAGQDLTDALKNNKTLTALLDVTDPEEPPKAGSELYKLDNVILTPHIAGCIGDEVLRMAEWMYNEYKLYETGKKLEYEVTVDMLETMA
jgi:phosphoglycerate dehydrogenase-like enzyme